MQHSFGLQITDLEAIPSVFEQKIPLEDAKKVAGGSRKGPDWSIADPIEDPFPDCPKPQKLNCIIGKLYNTVLVL